MFGIWGWSGWFDNLDLELDGMGSNKLKRRDMGYSPRGPYEDDEDEIEDFKIAQMQDMLIFLDKKQTGVMIGRVAYGFQSDGRFTDQIGHTTNPGSQVIDRIFDHLYRQTLNQLHRHRERTSIPHSKSLLLRLYEDVMDVVDLADFNAPRELF